MTFAKYLLPNRRDSAYLPHTQNIADEFPQGDGKITGKLFPAL
ncbi:MULTISPECIES: hypothetical protein [unclassified Anabaena]|nr:MULTISPECIES: hypothetical protein [unclassified Anabaena]